MRNTTLLLVCVRVVRCFHRCNLSDSRATTIHY